MGGHAGVQGGRKVRGTAAEWESWMKGGGGGCTGEKESWRKERGERSLFSVSEINYFYVCGLFKLCHR